MSADDFQSKYASVMESMLKSAVAETTKLFETMVDELKAEIAKMKKENEELKARCSQFERTRDQATVHIRESEPPPGRRDTSEKRDTAVQCDLVPLRTMLVEQCQPLRLSSLQNQRQQCGYEEVHYALQEHDYESHGEGNSQMAFILVKQESVLKQEEVESTVASRQVLRDKADSPWASPCGIENEGPFINTVCSTRETSLPQIHKETQVAMELPILVTYSGSQGAKNQPSEPEHSLVISLAAVKDDLEEESEVSQKTAEIGKQGELMTPEHLQASVAPQQSQREGEMSMNEQSDVTLQQNTDVQSTQDQLAQPIPLNNGEVCDQLKNSLADVEASSQPGLQIRRRRGRPPKKAKRVQQQMKEILQSSSSDSPTELQMEKSPSSSVITPSNQQRADTSLEDVETNKVGSLAVSVVCSSRRCSSEKEKLCETQQLSMDMEEGTIQAPSTKASSAVETLNTPPAESPQAPPVQPSECYTSVTLQDALLLVEAMNQSPTDNTSSPLQRKAEPAQTQCAPQTSEAQAHINDVTPKQNAVSLSPLPPSTAAAQTTVQLHPHSLITSVATTCRGKALPHKIIIVPRPAFSSMSRKIAEQSPNQRPGDISTVITAQNKSKLQGSTAAGLPIGTPSSSATQKTIHVTTSKLLPVVTKSTSTSQGLYSGTLLPPKISTAILRQVAAAASRNHQAQILTAQQDLAKSAAPVMMSTSKLISSTQELSVSVDTQTALNDVTTISLQKRDNTSDNLKTLTTLQTKEKLPAVVRLSRLPFPISTKESVFVSRLPTSGSAGSQSILKQGTTQEKPLSFVTSTQPSETLVLSTDNCPNLKETSVAMSVCNTRISEEPIDIEEKISSENCITLEESPTIAISMTDPLAASGTAGEPSSNLEDCELSIDQPIGEKQSAAFVGLTSTKTKDTSDPHSQMSKAQFLAHLAVSPVAQDPKEASSDSVDAEASRAETSISDKKRLQQTTLMAQLRSHIKTHLQAKRTDVNPEPLTETANCTVSPKKLRLENDRLNDKNTTSEPISLSPKNPGAVADFTSLKTTTTTTTDPTPMSRKKSGLCKDGVKPSVSETSASPRSSKPNSEATPVSPRRSGLDRDGVVSTNERSTSVSPRRSSSTKENATPEKTKNGLLTRRTSSTRSGASPKNTVTGVSPNTKITSLRSKRTSSSRDGVTAKRTKSTAVNPRISGLSKNCSSPKMSTSESTSFCRRRCTFAKDDASTKQIKAESSPCSPRSCSATADGASTKNTKNESDSPSVRWPKLSKDGNSPRKTRESTSIKKSRLIQDGATLKKNLRVVNAKKLANAAKAKTIAKMKNSNQSKLQSGATTSQLAENHASCKAVKRCRAKAVWTPPRLQASKTPPAGGKRSVNSPVKKEMVSPKSQGNIHVYPHSVSLHPIPIKAPPVVSPLQPLSVIGRRLLKNQCGECGRVLSSSAALESHVSLHTGRRPFSCTLCGKRFADSKGLKRHGRVHRNGRIHVCQQCGKGFVYRFGLTKHLQMVHSRIKPFVCQICNKGCFTKLDVEAHIRIHTGEKPFHCNLCEKKFTRRVDLNVHLRWHNGEKRHWCPYCGKGFLDFNNMKRHKYIHTGEKPHACPHCPKHFTQSGHLKKHVKNVHKIQ